jgi:hypothetical protein
VATDESGPRGGRTLPLVLGLVALSLIGALVSMWLPRSADRGATTPSRPAPEPPLVDAVPLDGLRRPAARMTLAPSAEDRVLVGSLTAQARVRALVSLQIRCTSSDNPVVLGSPYTTSNTRDAQVPLTLSVMWVVPRSATDLQCDLAVYSQTAVPGLEPADRVSLSHATLSVGAHGLSATQHRVAAASIPLAESATVLDTVVDVPQDARSALVFSELEVSTYGDGDPSTPPDGSGTVSLELTPDTGSCTGAHTATPQAVDPVEHHVKWHDSLRASAITGCSAMRLRVELQPGYRGPYLLEGDTYSSVVVVWQK